MHDKSKKYMVQFIDLFEKIDSAHFEPLFDEFYKDEHPDLKYNDRINDLITAYNNN